MTDFNDMELIEHIAGRGDSDLQRRIDEALAASAELRARYEELAVTWQLLGRADAALPARDLRDDVVALIERRHTQGDVLGRVGAAGWWRAAAAIVLAAGVGHLAGRVSLPDTSTDLAAVTETDVQQELEFDAIGAGPMFSFAQDVLIEPDSNQEDSS